MKALILAAGFGKRMRPITNTIPKAMIEISGTPLLFNSLDNLVAVGIKDIAIVVGHMADSIRAQIGNEWKGAKVCYFENTRYIETNNIISLLRATEYCDDDMLLLECDIYYPKELLDVFLRRGRKGDCSILVSPYNPMTMSGTVIRVDGDNALELILGKWQGDGFDYSNTKKTVNIYYFTKEFIGKYMSLVRWYVENIDENSYYETVLGGMIYWKRYDIRVVEVSEKMWCEIDDVGDLNRAKDIFGKELKPWDEKSNNVGE